MGEAEDCGTAGSPWGTQPASPDKTMHGRGDGGRPLGPIKDVSSDSDEGCATWGSRHRYRPGDRQEDTHRRTGVTWELLKGSIGVVEKVVGRLPHYRGIGKLL
jgi:hypothetical protein